MKIQVIVNESHPLLFDELAAMDARLRAGRLRSLADAGLRAERGHGELRVSSEGRNESQPRSTLAPKNVISPRTKTTVRRVDAPSSGVGGQPPLAAASTYNGVVSELGETTANACSEPTEDASDKNTIRYLVRNFDLGGFD